MSPSSRAAARLPVIKLVPLGEEVSEFLDGVIASSSSGNNTDDQLLVEQQASSNTSSSTLRSSNNNNNIQGGGNSGNNYNWPEELHDRISKFEERANLVVKEMYRRQGWIHSDFEYSRDDDEDAFSDDEEEEL